MIHLLGILGLACFIIGATVFLSAVLPPAPSPIIAYWYGEDGWKGVDLADGTRCVTRTNMEAIVCWKIRP